MVHTLNYVLELNRDSFSRLRRWFNLVLALSVRRVTHIADMRATDGNQWEIRELTEEVLEEPSEWCPITFAYYGEEMRVGRIDWHYNDPVVVNPDPAHFP
ncbi:FAD-dependent thymidylate synthase [Haladaptatus litoreus]|uniref:FAD-dependent thymidylate synthase n=1 Tax=Haladaptatus litoreus TaxID=553468 RepID=UPI0034A30760